MGSLVVPGLSLGILLLHWLLSQHVADLYLRALGEQQL